MSDIAIDVSVGTVVHFDGWAYRLKSQDALSAIDIGLYCTNPRENIRYKQNWKLDRKAVKDYYEQKCLSKERVK
jgi:hypothetical protein